MVDEKLKVFLSWSGERSGIVASALRDWLPNLFDNVDLFMSQADIASGQRGLTAIEEALAGTRFGIIVVTPENQDKPWINFEAGALSKVVQPETESRVMPLLVGMTRPTDLHPGPLTQFQARLFDRDGVRRVVTELAKAVTADETNVVRRMERFWDDLEQATKGAVAGPAPVHASRRADGEILEEILDIARGLRRDLATGESSSARRRTAVQDRNTKLENARLADRTARQIGLKVVDISWDNDGMLRLALDSGEATDKNVRQLVSNFADLGLHAVVTVRDGEPEDASGMILT